MDKISNMTAEQIRTLLKERYQWDVEAMARDYRRTIPQMTALLRDGGVVATRDADGLKAASYDVVLSPMVNVTLRVADPENPTEEETERILEAAFEAVCDDAREKLGPENASMIRLYRVEGDEEGQTRDHYVSGSPEYDNIDPDILIELTQLTYNRLYEAVRDGVEVATTIRNKARQLSAKYVNTDWRHDDLDFWITMEEEADAFLAEKGADR